MVAEKDLGSSLLFFALFVVMLWVATERRAYLVRRRRAVRRRRRTSPGRSSPTCRTGSTIWLEPVDRPARQGLPDRPGAGSRWPGGGVAGTGLGLGTPDTIPGRDRLHLRRHRRGARPARRHRRPHRLPADGRRRPAHRRPGRARRSRSCWPPGSPRSSASRRSSSSAASPGCSRSPASRCRSCPTAARRCVANYVLLALLLRISDDTQPRERAPRPRPTSRSSRRVNKQIRRLGVALIVLLRRAVRAAQLHPGRSRPTSSTTTPATRRPIVRDFSRPRGDDHHRRRRRARPARSPTDDQFKYQREYPSGDLFGHVTGYFSFTFGATGVERTYNDELSGHDRRAAAPQRCRDLFVDDEHTGNVTLTVAQRPAAGRPSDALGDRKGSVVALDPQTGAILALWSYPSLRPEPARRPRPATRPRTTQGAARRRPGQAAAARSRTASASSPARRSRSSPARPACRPARSRPTQPVYPVDASYTPPQTDRPLRNFGGEACGGTLFEILAGVVQHRLRPDGRRPRRRPDGRRRRGVRVQRRRRRSTCPAPAQSVFPHRHFDRRPAGAGPVAASARTTCRPRRCRWRWSPPASPTAADHDAARAATRSATATATVVARYDAEPVEARRSARRPPTTMRQAHDRRGRSNGTATGLPIPGFEVGGKTGTAQLGTDAAASRTPGSSASPARPGDPQVAVAVHRRGPAGRRASRPAAGSPRPIAQAVMRSRCLGRRLTGDHADDRRATERRRGRRRRPPRRLG